MVIIFPISIGIVVGYLRPLVNVSYSPFSVAPKSAYLNPNEKINIKVIFKTMHLGETNGVLHATFETGIPYEIFCTYKFCKIFEKCFASFPYTPLLI